MSSIRSLLVGAIATRIVVLPVQALATALTTYLTVSTLGATVYATVGLLIGLQGLFGFLNLGSSAAVANAAGESLVLGRSHLFSVLVTATRVTSVAGACLVPASLLIAALGLWPSLLGLGDPELLTSGAIVACLAVALLQPLSQGVGVLMATGHTVAATAATAAPSVVGLGLVALAAALHAPAIAFVIGPYAGLVIVASVSAFAAARLVHISLSDLLGSVIDRSYRGAKIGHEARPALIIWLLLPLAYQTDRILLSHLSSAQELASYNVAAQFYAAAFSIVAVGASAMWGYFAGARVSGDSPSAAMFVRLSTAFAALGLAIGVVYVVAMPSVSPLVSGGEIAVSPVLALSFGALLVSQAFHQPSAMIQTDASGLRFNAAAVMCMTAVNVTLGVLLTPALGAVGPVLASLVSMTLLLALPSFIRALTMLSSSRGLPQGVSGDDVLLSSGGQGRETDA